MQFANVNFALSWPDHYSECKPFALDHIFEQFGAMIRDSPYRLGRGPTNYMETVQLSTQAAAVDRSRNFAGVV